MRYHLRCFILAALVGIALARPRLASALGDCPGPPPTCAAGLNLSCNCLGMMGPLGECSWACEEPNKGGCGTSGESTGTAALAL